MAGRYPVGQFLANELAVFFSALQIGNLNYLDVVIMRQVFVAGEPDGMTKVDEVSGDVQAVQAALRVVSINVDKCDLW